MIAWVEFYTSSTGWNGTDFSGPVKDVPLLGSDGCYQLDGRRNLGGLKYEAERRLKALRLVHKTITGYVIHRSTCFSRDNPATPFIPVKPEAVL